MRFIKEGIKSGMALRDIPQGAMFVFNLHDEDPCMVTNQFNESYASCVELTTGVFFSYSLAERVLLVDGTLNWRIK